jgi:hypothetical protein
MKTIPAIIAALVVTLVLGFAMIAIGGDALANTNSVPVLNSPDQNTAAVSGSALDTQVADLQALVQQYQARENQYKTELDQAPASKRPRRSLPPMSRCSRPSSSAA